MIYPKVSIIVLNWNGREILRECLESLNKLDYTDCETVVADNGSSDGSQEMVKQYFPLVQLIENGENLGCGEGYNKAIGYTLNKGAKYFLLFSNDMVADKDMLKELITVAESGEMVGITCPKVIDYDESEKIHTVGGLIDLKTGNSKILGQYEMDCGQYEEAREVEFTGVPLIKKDVISKIGLPDSRFFLTFWDADYSLRTLRAGFKIIYTPQAKVRHRASSTITRMARQLTTYHDVRGRFLLERKHASKAQYLTFLSYFLITYFLPLTGAALLRWDFKLLKAAVNGACCGLCL